MFRLLGYNNLPEVSLLTNGTETHEDTVHEKTQESTQVDVLNAKADVEPMQDSVKLDEPEEQTVIEQCTPKLEVEDPSKFTVKDILKEWTKLNKPGDSAAQQQSELTDKPTRPDKLNIEITSKISDKSKQSDNNNVLRMRKKGSPVSNNEVSQPEMSQKSKSENVDKVLVLGASGVIGSEFCKLAIENGLKVTCIVRDSSDMTFLEKYPSSQYEIIRIDFNEFSRELASRLTFANTAAVSFLGSNPDTNQSSPEDFAIQRIINTKFVTLCRENNISPFVFCSSYLSAYSTDAYNMEKFSTEYAASYANFDDFLTVRPAIVESDKYNIPKGCLFRIRRFLEKYIDGVKTHTPLQVAASVLFFLKTPHTPAEIIFEPYNIVVYGNSFLNEHRAKHLYQKYTK